MILVAVSSTTLKSLITHKILPKRWGIGLKTAADTLRETTKMGYWSKQGKFAHWYRTNQRKMGYQRLDCILYNDTLFSKRKLQPGSTCGQCFLIDFNFFYFWGLTFKKLAYTALVELFERFGVHRQLHSYKAKENMSEPQWWKLCKKQENIHTTHTKPHSQWHTYAKERVAILKWSGACLVRKTGAPPV